MDRKVLTPRIPSGPGCLYSLIPISGKAGTPTTSPTKKTHLGGARDVCPMQNNEVDVVSDRTESENFVVWTWKGGDKLVSTVTR